MNYEQMVRRGLRHEETYRVLKALIGVTAREYLAETGNPTGADEIWRMLYEGQITAELSPDGNKVRLVPVSSGEARQWH